MVCALELCPRLTAFVALHRYLQLVGVDIPSEATRFIDTNAYSLHDYVVSLAEALRLSSIVGSAIGISFYVIAWVVLCLDFRAQVLQARRGLWQFNVSKVTIGAALTYIGTQVSNGLLTYLVISLTVSAFTIFFAWKLTQDLLLWYLQKNTWFLMILIPTAIDMVITKLFLRHVVTPKWIKARFIWAAFDLYKILLQIVAGLVTALVRFVLVVITALFSLPRLDRSPFPAWLEVYLLLDSGSKSYQGVILLHHTMNNPVMRVAAWIMQEDAAARRDQASATRRGLVSAERRRISNRWNKLWMMHKNPAIAAYSTSGAKGVQLKEIHQALRQMEQEQKKVQRDIKEINKQIKHVNTLTAPQGRRQGQTAWLVPHSDSSTLPPHSRRSWWSKRRALKPADMQLMASQV